MHGLTGTLALNPVPQAVAPLFDVQKNRDSFFDTPIETMTDEGKLPAARYDAFTSPTMRAAFGQLTGPPLGLSPKQLEHLWDRYLGTIGIYALSVADLLAREAYPSMGERPDLDGSDPGEHDQPDEKLVHGADLRCTHQPDRQPARDHGQQRRDAKGQRRQHHHDEDQDAPHCLSTLRSRSS